VVPLAVSFSFFLLARARERGIYSAPRLYSTSRLACVAITSVRMCSASCTSGLYLRVWGWVGPSAGGGLVRVVRSFFSAPPAPKNGRQVVQTPTRASILADRRALDQHAIDACEIRFGARIIMELPLVPLSASDKVRAHRFLSFSPMPLKSVFSGSERHH
jgi:hypothetical protein